MSTIKGANKGPISTVAEGESVKAITKRVEDMIFSGQTVLREYKKEIDMLR